MMGRQDARNMQSFITEQIWIIGASGWLFKKKSIMMHGSVNVKCIEFIDKRPTLHSGLTKYSRTPLIQIN
jgi:hypothetical protein